MLQAWEHLYQHGRLAIAHLYNSPPEKIPRYDIAEMNLISACGLPSTESMDLRAMLGLLDAWANRCQTYITQKTPLFESNPSRFGSLAHFRMGAIIHVLIKQIGLRYNPALAGEPTENPEPLTDPADTFIHGVLGPRRMGTCCSLPVVLVAIGRRLGYPLKLVLAPQHAFCRWDSPEERFNIEFHEGGLNSHPDDHYRQWPFKWPPQLIERERLRPYFLQSLTPQQELAHFAFNRASALDVAAGRRKEALAAMNVAQRLWPCHNHAVWITHLATKACYPDKQWPHAPCEETAGRAAMERLAKEKGAVMTGSRITGPIQ